MTIRSLEGADVPRWIELRHELWPDASLEEHGTDGRAALNANPPLVVFVAEENSTLVGFLELGVRSVAEGCSSSPVPYVEGWYVSPPWRRRGIGSDLMGAAEVWSRGRGYGELASDTEAHNQLSRTVHAALGFVEVETLVVFRKELQHPAKLEVALASDRSSLPMNQRVFPQLRMTNWARSRAFYVDGLGFHVDWEHQFEPGFPVFAQLTRDGLSLFLTEHTGDCQVGGAAYFVVDDVDALHRDIAARGIRPDEPPEDTPWQTREMNVIDPDGNRLRFANPGAR